MEDLPVLYPAAPARLPGGASARTADWDVVFDARGHFREPHTRHAFGLGTVEVREYIRGWRWALEADGGAIELPHGIETSGPRYRYHSALFVEKEGFDLLLQQAGIEDRYDVALMSTKGMTVTAARSLIEGALAGGGDYPRGARFDKSGLEILDKFTRNTRRYRYRVPPTVIDLGLRLDEARAMGLASEPVTYHSGVDPRESLRELWRGRGGVCRSCTGAARPRPPGTRRPHRAQRHGLPTVPGLAGTQASGRGGGEGGP